METAAFIPVKEYSSRIPNKNFRDFDGDPLFEHFFKKLWPSSPFDSVYVNTDSEHVKSTAEEYGFNIIDRPAYLSEDDANGNDLLLYDAELIDVDVYFQLFVTAPLLTPTTIHKAHKIMTTKEEHDSIFTVEKHNSFFWKDGQSLNYDTKELPRSQDLEPLYEETTGLYGIKKEALLDRECRIGYDPYMLEVDSVEAIDIDEMNDLRLARLVIEDEVNGEYSLSERHY
jgi:N-acylneuraminate cytidylyltransferase